MTEHEQYHEVTIDLLAEIALISNAMLGVFVVSAAIIIWALLKR